MYLFTYNPLVVYSHFPLTSLCFVPPKPEIQCFIVIAIAIAYFVKYSLRMPLLYVVHYNLSPPPYPKRIILQPWRSPIRIQHQAPLALHGLNRWYLKKLNWLNHLWWLNLF